jgi:hypothetical protein
MSYKFSISSNELLRSWLRTIYPFSLESLLSESWIPALSDLPRGADGKKPFQPSLPISNLLW